MHCCPAINLHQRGSALIVAMLIAAIVSLMSVRFAESFMWQVDQAESQHEAHLVTAYVHAAEQLAAQLLLVDMLSADIDHRVDHNLENWAQQIPPLPTDNGWLEVRISDGQALFNLNNLVVKTEHGDDASAPLILRFSPSQKQFIRLLQSFDDYPIAEADAIAMTEALIDWIDQDDITTGQGGGESLFYSNSGVTAQAANQLLSDLSELNLVRHFNPSIIERLRPWVVVLPEPTAINLNTAPPKVLSSINQSQVLQVISDPALLSLVGEREQRAFYSVTEFFDHAVMQSLVPDADTNSRSSDLFLFSVNSQWFRLHTRLTVNGRESQWLSLIARDDEQTRVWSRHKIY